MKLQMQEAFVNINKIPTKVLTYGRWITETPKRNEKIILIIPGNPGIVGFYKKFMKILHERHNCPVWAIGYSGHENCFQRGQKTNFPQLLGLRDQIEQKRKFIEEYIPEDASLYIMGHSIGSYMALELLKEPTIEKRIAKTCLMFPTFERMVDTQHGKFMYNYVRHVTTVVIFLSWIFTILPKLLSVGLLRLYMWITNMPSEFRSTTFNVVHPKILEQVFFLAFQELEQVKDRDNDNIRKNVHRINILYGESDGWCLKEFCDEIKKEFPNIEARTCIFPHNFLFNHNQEVSEIVSKWICTID